MSNLSEFVRSRLALRQKPLDEHPDANLLLGFAERELSAHANAVVLAHLERCAECREILAFSMPESAAALPELQKRGPAWQAWRWPAAALAGMIATALMVTAVLTPGWFSTTPAAVQPASLESKLPKQASSQAAAPAATPSPVIAKVAAPAPRKKTVARAKQKDTTPALAQVEQPILETPPLIIPRMGFQRLDAATASNPVQASMKRLVDASIEPPGRNSIWRIEENGTVSKSQDGRAWTPVRVGQHTRLYALSVNGGEVWAGGADGGLFHSTDDGANWRQVEVRGESGAHLTDTITKIGSTPQHALELTTNSGTVWVSFDGRLWHQQ
jgi:Photosynthesis system II assembly factor YCF48